MLALTKSCPFSLASPSPYDVPICKSLDLASSKKSFRRDYVSILSPDDFKHGLIYQYAISEPPNTSLHPAELALELILWFIFLKKMVETIQAPNKPNYDRLSELKAFVEAKTGVKGLVDAGVTKVPNMFIQPPENMIISDCTKTHNFIIPMIDLNGIDKEDPIRHKEIVEQVRDACETWGFFQVENHSIPIDVLEEMKNGGRRFFEQDNEVKKQWYNRDRSKPVGYNSHMDMDGTKPADWKDNLYCRMAPNLPNPDQLPHACRCSFVLPLSNKFIEVT